MSSVTIVMSSVTIIMSSATIVMSSAVETSLKILLYLYVFAIKNTQNQNLWKLEQRRHLASTF